MNESSREQFKELIAKFDTAMLTTQTAQGELRSRPMSVVKQFGAEAIYFATGEDSAKVDELLQHGQVNVSMQSSKRYLSLSGTAQIVVDRSIIDSLWGPALKPWFPEGKDDPDLVLIKMDIHIGEYWDLSGTKQLKFLYEAGKAIATGEKMEYDPEDIHDKIELNH
jgi:general stress protein 26